MLMFQRQQQQQQQQQQLQLRNQQQNPPRGAGGAMMNTQPNLMDPDILSLQLRLLQNTHMQQPLPPQQQQQQGRQGSQQQQGSQQHRQQQPGGNSGNATTVVNALSSCAHSQVSTPVTSTAVTPLPLSTSSMGAQQQQPQPELSKSSSTVAPAAAAASSSSAPSSNAAQPSHTAHPFLLPSTMMPPSVLASVFNGSSNSSHSSKKRPLSGGGGAGNDGKRGKSSRPIGGSNSSVGTSSHMKDSTTTPQEFVNRILRERGYGEANQVRISAEKAGYDTVPSPLQLASFGTELVMAVHTSDVPKLRQLLSCGLSPNPCNQFRDSIVDLVCKRANEAVFACLMEHGCDLRICDGFGRTPLHHCCWASEFSPEIAHTIIKRDWQQLFMEDKRGQTPLEYVRNSMAQDWLQFLDSYRDEFWPVGGKAPVVEKSLKEERADGALADPDHALPVPLATAVSAGKVTPQQVAAMTDDKRSSYGDQPRDEKNI